MDYEDFAPLFGKWAPLFKEFIEGEEMDEIYSTLKREGQEKVIAPDSDDTFRTFMESDPSNVRAVIYLMDPYPKKYRNGALQAVGVAMDCRNSPDNKLQPSLEKWYDSVDEYVGKKVQRSPSLQYLLEQGVLMLNTGLTCRLNETGSHCKLWEPFHKYFLEKVMAGRDIPYVLCGSSSQELKKYIDSGTLFIEHPVAASYAKRKWDSGCIFEVIDKAGTDKVYWDRKEYESQLVDVCPFEMA